MAYTRRFPTGCPVNSPVSHDDITAFDAGIASSVQQDGSTMTGDLIAPNVKVSGAFQLTSRTFTRFASLLFTQVGSAGWFSTSLGLPQQSTTGTNICFAIEPPDLSSLVGVTLYLDPANGHGGLPGIMPQIILLAVSATGITPVNSVSDPSATVGAYEALHNFFLDPGPRTVHRDVEALVVQVVGEGGANFLTGLKVQALTYTFATTQLDQGAG